MLVQKQYSPWWFVSTLLAVYLGAFWIVSLLQRIESPDSVALGLTIDIVFVVPVAYYLIFVRGRNWPAITIIPVFILSFTAATRLIPAEHHTLLNMMGVVLPIAELGLISYLGIKIWRLFKANRLAVKKGGDFFDNLRCALSSVVDNPLIVGVLAYEIAVFHYTLYPTRRPTVDREFTYHERSGYGAIVFAILMVALVELLGVHFLLRTWSETAMWIHVALSAYGIIWLIGDYRAMASRPHELGDEWLQLRVGLRWNVKVSPSQIACLRRVRKPSSDEDYLNAVPFGSPRYIVEFKSAVKALGPYGITRSVRQVGIIVDDKAGFEKWFEATGIAITSD